MKIKKNEPFHFCYFTVATTQKLELLMPLWLKWTFFIVHFFLWCGLKIRFLCLGIEERQNNHKKWKLRWILSFWNRQKSALIFSMKIFVFSAVQRVWGNEQRWIRTEKKLDQSCSALNVSGTSTQKNQQPILTSFKDFSATSHFYHQYLLIRN